MQSVVQDPQTPSIPEPAPLSDEVYVFPASYAQQRLWILDQLEPGSPFYNIPAAVRLTGKLDRSALQRALDEIGFRHETLRTTFSVQEGEPVQVIALDRPFDLPVVDLQTLPPEQREAEVQRLAVEEARAPFDLRRGPLFRARLLCLGADEHVLLLTMHHIISDGWSIGVFIHEVAVLYTAFSAGQPSPLPDLPIQYADYAIWQRDRLKETGLDSQVAYWKEKLGGELPVLKLPTDRPRPAAQTFRGATTSRHLPLRLAMRLKSFSRAEDATLFMTLLAAFQALLYRYSGQEDLCVGSPIANRTRAEVEGLIGFFVNTLVLRADLSGEPSFRELLRRIKAATLEAYANQDLPFDMLVEVLRPERDMSYNPLFQVMFILQNAPARSHSLPGLSLSALEAETGTSTFDLTLSMSELPDGLDASIEYNTDLFDRDTIDRMLAHFELLLEGILDHPDDSVSILPLLSPAEREQVLYAWNATGRDYPLDRLTVVDLVDAQAARTPHALALVWSAPDTPPEAALRLTYAELGARSNRLARLLRSLEVGPNIPVGVCLERGLDLVVAVLAVLKAGGAYLPLDPNYPAERLAYMLEDSSVPVLLTQQSLLSGLPPCSARVICLDEQAASIAALSADPLPVFSTPEDLAYLIYTSGSTGRPKGVLVSQSNLVNAFLAWHEDYRLEEVRAHLQMANFAFDVFSADLVRALGSGGKLVLCPREYLLSPPQLYALMRQESVDCAEFVPAVLRELVRHLEDTRQDFGFMRLLICGSDVWYVEEFRRIQRLCGSRTRLINSFGLTEATIDSCYFEGSQIPLPDDAVVPIGRPFPNQRLYILDRHQQPLPPLVQGELYVGGAGVARGYLNHPELTAERFIPDPFSSTLGVTLYRTGDLARYRKDGQVEFLGRQDDQVKIRGFRVEIGEIEALLVQHPAVSQAAVMVREPRPGDQRLVAYLVPAAPETPPEISHVRDFLQERLPVYMLPAAFVLLEGLPLTPNGKVNRKVLPAPDWSSQVWGETYVAPRTPLEETLVEIWAQVLGMDAARISVQDNFFDLGGHSLLATQVVSRVRDGLKVDLPLRRIFEAPSVAALARVVEEGLAGQAGPAVSRQVPCIAPVPRGRDLPLSFAQQRLWFLDQLEPNSPSYNIPESLRLSGSLDTAVLERVLKEIIRRHEILRTTFLTVDGQPVQRIAPHLDLPVPLVDLQELPPARREAEMLRLAGEEAARPFDLSVGPLLRVRLLRLAPQDHVILLTIHHIIGDDWSTGVLVQEVAALYAAFSTGQPSPLPELSIQYADFAAWQRGWLQGEVLDEQLGFWKETLRGLPPLLELPTDRPRPPVQTFRGAYETLLLSPELTGRIHAFCKQEGVTLFMAMLAAFQALLARYSGQEDIPIGTPIANRNRADIEPLIGFFVNTLVLRGDLSGEPSFRELLKRVREQSVGAYAHQDLPFEKIVDALQPERNLSHSPLFQVMFVLQNTPRRAQELPGLRFSPIEAHSGTAKFDLTLFMLEEGGRLAGAMEYNTDLFDAATIHRMLVHFHVLLEGILEEPDLPLGRLSILTPDERGQILEEWNRTQADIPALRCAHHLIEDQVRRTPQAAAVVFRDRSLTYQELECRSNQLARYLQARGVGPEVCVGLCLERSLEMMVALLGVWKAGGAYVPLDPHYPPERLAFMLQDSGLRVLLTQERLLAGLPLQDLSGPVEAVCLDRDWPQIALENETPPLSAVGPGNLAYVIYTSGSTGRPKGAMILHRGLVNYLSWCQRAYPIDQGRGSPVHSSISFDLTVTSLFPALLAGKTVFMLPEDLGVEALTEFLQRENDFSLVKITPAHLKLLGEQVRPEQAALTTRAFIIGGENLLVDHVAFWQEHAPAAALVNEYGPTETVVGCCVYWAPPGKHRDGIIPIGRPIINTRLYVLDRYLQPVPVGVRGELYIGGVGVARGYLNRPELTAERFLSDPFNPEPGARMYKTGDLVRWLPDGNLECLGRIDFQVKIRGFRVELGEIEAVLAQHPAVREVVVWVREEHGRKRLVAYLVLQDAAAPPPSNEELRAYLQERLPEYMLPSAYVLLDELPLTPNGKLDRQALPDPAPAAAVSGEDAASLSLSGQTLRAIWAQLLGLDPAAISSQANFFELGGDSILTLQVVSRARQAGLFLTPKLLFEHPTLADLAALAQPAGSARAVQERVPEGPVPLSPVQTWFFSQPLPQPAHWNQSILLSLPRSVRVEDLGKAVDLLLERHAALRLSFRPQAEEGSWKQEVMAVPPGFALPAYDLSALPPEEQVVELERLCSQVQASLDLARPPLLAAAHFDLGEERGARLLLAVHHLAVDGVSWRILLEDLSLALSGQPLPPLTSSYPAWCLALHQAAAAPALSAELEYWRSLPVLPALPLDFPSGTNRERDTAALSLRLSAEETRCLLQEAPNVYHADVPALLLAALLQSLREWPAAAGQALWGVEMEGHGREDLGQEEMDLSRSVGWFTSLYPWRVDLRGAGSLAAVLREVKESLRGVPRHGLGFGLLRWLHPDQVVRQELASLGATPISFNYLGQFGPGDPAADGEVGFAAEARGEERGLENPRTSIWEITAAVLGGQMQVEWSYSREQFRPRTLQELGERFQSHLRELLSLKAVDEAALAASDFSGFGWDQDDLSDILGEIEKLDE